MSARFPGEPFSPDRLPDPNAPAPGPESIFHTIYRAAVTGADAYRVTRTAVRREGTVLRLGNRFVPLARYHEIAFLALGSAAVSQALAVSAALGDRLTQGFVVGPDPLPREVPFRSRVEPTGWPARSPVADEAVELAGGLTERDLLLVLLSPGALGFLAKTPADVPVDEWTRWLHALPDRGATSGEVSLAVRVLADGAVGGRLAAATRADVSCLVVDRGDGAGTLGGGPTRAVTAEETARVRTLLDRTRSAPAWALARLDRRRADTPASLPRTDRPVAVATPADALHEVDEAVREKRWRAILGELKIEASSEATADRLLERTEEILRTEDPAAAVGGKASRGLIVFAGASLGVPEGVDDRPAIARFLSQAATRLGRREASVGIVRTAGGPPDLAAPGGVVLPTGPGARPTLQPLRMRPGITDVGLLAAMVVPVK